jgi:hypothetical protein
MKLSLLVAMLAAVTTTALAADVGVSVSIGQPGFYGQIDIGNYPPPMVIYPQPMIVERMAVDRPPIYLRVPPGHAKHWSRHCREYNACGERVLFVQDNWYHHEYVPRYQERNRQDYRRDDHDDGDHGRHNDNRDNGEKRGHQGNDNKHDH